MYRKSALHSLLRINTVHAKMDVMQMANYLCANGVCIIEIKIKFKKMLTI